MDNSESRSLQKRLLDCSKFLEEYRWIYDFDMNEFFTGCMDRIPDDLRCLQNSSASDLLELSCGLYQEHFPTKLKNIVEQVTKLRLSRQPDSIPTSAYPYTNILTRGMNPKKIHEVNYLSSVIMETLSASGHKDMLFLDIGSGEGYLSRVLAYGHQQFVIGIDDSHAKSATQRSEAIVKEIWRSHLKNQEDGPSSRKKLESSLYFLPYFIPANVTTQEFMSLIPTSPQFTSRSDNLFLIGLHTCGSLASTMLRLFLEIPQIKVFVGVGCCYYKGDRQSMYPMSKLVQSFEQKLDYNPLKLACEPYGQWCEYTDEEKQYTLRRTFYRTILEVILREKFEKFSGKFIVRNVSKDKCGSIVEYIQECLKRLQLHSEDHVKTQPNITMTDSEIMVYYEKLLPQFSQLQVFYTLQMLIAPVIESFLVLDRVRFLEEHANVKAFVRPIFSEQLSPRNLAVIAIKEN